MGPIFFVVNFPFLVMKKIFLSLTNSSHVAISIRDLLKPVRGVALMVNKKYFFLASMFLK